MMDYDGIARQPAAADLSAGPDSGNSPDGVKEAASETEQEAPSFSPQDVAERVYRLFCENLRRERERRGYWG